MKNDTEGTDLATLEPRDEAPVAAIIKDMEAATCAATGFDVWTRLERNAAALNCTWDGKTGDGRQPKPSEWDPERKSLWRWEGAPDVAIPLVDMLVRWLSRIRISVWNRGDSRIAPQKLPDEKGGESAAAGMAAVWQLVMDFFLYLGAFDYSYQFKLAARITDAFGYSVLLSDWQKARRLEKKQMRLQNVVDALVMQQVEQYEGEGELPPEVVEQITQEALVRVEMLLMDDKSALRQNLNVVLAVDPTISNTEALAVLEALKTDPAQAADYFVARDDGGAPTLRAFIPWAQCIHSADMTGTGECDLFGYPEYLTQARVRELAAAEDWDVTAVETMLEEHKNQLYHSGFEAFGIKVPNWAFNGVGVGLAPNEDLLSRVPHWLVWRVWKRTTNGQGLPTVYRGVLHHCMKEAALLWEATDLERIPIIVDTSEPVSYALQARGVGDVVVGMQNAIKDTVDGEGARGRLGSNPPFVRSGTSYAGMRPGLEINGGLGRGGLEGKLNRFVEVPTVDIGALKVSAEVERWAREYYCYAPTTDAMDKQMFVEELTFGSLRIMSRTLLLMWEQIQENVSELHASNIAGRQVKLDINSRDQLAGKADIHVGFHADGLSEDKVDKFFDWLLKLGQSDRAARVDWGEAIEMALQMRVPAYARRLLLTKEAALANVKSDQELRMVKIANGVPLDYPEVATNPEARMAYMQQWQGIPGNGPTTQAAAELLQKEADYLEFQIQQQTTNPATGRSGVKPNDDLAEQLKPNTQAA